MTQAAVKVPSLLDQLQGLTPGIPVTRFLIVCNVTVFVAMLFSGASLWPSPSEIQLAWGANFAPATQDGQWWRLFTAMFLHFGVVHLFMNMWALWDCGQLVERMYGRGRFFVIYILSGLMGNLFSLVMQGNNTISGGASGAVFSLYGALITFLWRERGQIDVSEFKWLYWAAIIFSAATILMGFLVSGIDNYAHIGGFLTGILLSIVIPKPLKIEHSLPSVGKRIISALLVIFALQILIVNLPQPKYRWSDEVLVRKSINDFWQNELAVKYSLRQYLMEGNAGTEAFDDLAVNIDNNVSKYYEDSYDELSKLPLNPAMPSAQSLQNLLQYTAIQKAKTHALAERYRAKANALPRVRTFPYVIQKEEK